MLSDALHIIVDEHNALDRIPIAGRNSQQTPTHLRELAVMLAHQPSVARPRDGTVQGQASSPLLIGAA
jgi:hypothetical protein